MAKLRRMTVKRYFKLRPRLSVFFFIVILCFTLYVVHVPFLFHGHDSDVVQISAHSFPQSAEFSRSHQLKDVLVKELVQKYRVDMDITLPPGLSPWNVSRNWATSRALLPDYAPELGAVLNAMATARIEVVDDPGRRTGNQLKLLLTLEGGQRALFKPKWYSRDAVWSGNLCDVYDSHNAEIAAFHLSRVLGFRQTPLSVGRVLSVSKDILPVATEYLLETLYQVPENNTVCLYGHCYLCDKKENMWIRHLCTSDDAIEGAVILWMPDHLQLRENYRDTHPWLRLCYESEKTLGVFKNASHCDAVQNSRSQPPLHKHPEQSRNPFFNDSALFLDLMDASIFQYIINNADRKVSYAKVPPDSARFLVMMDNGKSFQDPYRDEWLILAPLIQCCIVRQTTYDRLTVLSHGVLSSVMREVLTSDP